jgi:hypothetical protein
MFNSVKDVRSNNYNPFYNPKTFRNASNILEFVEKYDDRPK